MEELLGQIGQTIKALRWLLVQYGQEDSYTIDEVEIIFPADRRFILGCASDGRVFSKLWQERGSLRMDEVNEARWVEFKAARGTKLRDVAADESTLTLKLNGMSLLVDNAGDELEIHVDGRQFDTRVKTWDDFPLIES